MAKKPKLPETTIPYPAAMLAMMDELGIDPKDAAKPMGKFNPRNA
jgi:hypothetical protein